MRLERREERCAGILGEGPPQQGSHSGSPVWILRQVCCIATKRCTNSTREERYSKPVQETNGGSWTRTNEVLRRSIYSPIII